MKAVLDPHYWQGRSDPCSWVCLAVGWDVEELPCVAVCVRVCRSCHLSGGTDVVDLPDILLPAGQYLDLFDSESETDHSGGSSDEELVEV